MVSNISILQIDIWSFPKAGTFKSSKSWMTILKLKSMMSCRSPILRTHHMIPFINGPLNGSLQLSHKCSTILPWCSHYSNDKDLTIHIHPQYTNCHHLPWHIPIWLAVSTPQKNMSSSVRCTIPNVYNKNMLQTTKQPSYPLAIWHNYWTRP